ncbi:phospholipid transport system substrate-binding protein [Desulfocicer vacuolatum DSM 3385]|uniref:Phospholipid transport system substrate-binding protein n=1 Tax=Desulfocicer vacuolatum DSM 3385 TaxID=1121400 RepID=A0A1W1ZMW0_9BACT|nr:ABC transporter substrate-binding protein [Desulfocicer vacuolatum]SMC49759.1 phospholipid transport system substrate-binding protein [Desulfocicer vacuolatum DSM 3385]
MKKYMIIMVMIAGFIMWAFPAPASETEPRRVVENGIDDVLAILNKPEYQGGMNITARDELLFEKAKELFDFYSFAMGALGRSWRGFSPAQRDAFISYFSRLIAQTYFAKIEGEQLSDLSVRYVAQELLAPTKSGRQRADIFTEVSHAGVVTPVDYRMLKPPGGVWKIYDVKIEGVSLLGNYREQYRERFMESPDELIKEVREKVENGN